MVNKSTGKGLLLFVYEGFYGGSDSKEFACNERDRGLIPGSGRSLEKVMAPHSSILSLENSMDRGPWWATVHGVAKSWT